MGGMVSPSPVQEDFRIRIGDSVALNSTTWTIAQNVDANITIGTAFRVRFQFAEVNGANYTDAIDLYYNVDGGSYTAVDGVGGTTENVKMSTSGQFTDGDATTDLLTAGSGTFVAGDGLYTQNAGGYALNSEHTELEYSLFIPSGTASVGEVIRLQLGSTGASNNFDAYDNTPVITVVAGATRRIFVVS